MNSKIKSFFGLVLIITCLLTYFYFRDFERLLLLYSITLVTPFLVVYYLLSAFLKKFIYPYKKLFLGLGIIIFLIFSYFNSRLSSYDGYYVTLRFINAISHKGYINQLEYPLKPYLGEIILTIFNEVNLLNLFIGVLFVLVWIQTSKLLEKYTSNPKVKNVALIITMLSPSMLAFGFIELKIDLIVVNLILLAFLLFNNYLRLQKTYFLYLTSFILGISLLVKFSVFFLALVFMIWLVLTIFKEKKPSYQKIMISNFLFLGPLISWYLIFGGTVPTLENYLKFESLFTNKTLNLHRNKEILNQCFEEKIKTDYNSYMYGSRSPLAFLHPFIYLTKYKNEHSVSMQPLAIPGIFIYLGMILVLIEVFSKKFWIQNYFYKGTFIVGIFTSVFFLIFVSSVFWYILPIFFIYALKISQVITHFYELQKSKIIRIVLVLFFSALIFSQLIYVLISKYFIMGYESSKSYREEDMKKTRNSEKINQDNFLEALAQDKIILDASEHINLVQFTYFENWDYKILKSNYYFVSSKKSHNEMLMELKNINVGYILVHPEQFSNKWFQGCPKQNNDSLKEFLEKNTTKVEVKLDNAEVYKIM